jgi:hypothetical protein
MFGGNAIAECPAINGMRWNAGSQSETDLLLVEHTELRLEINLTMQSRNTILTFGFATLRGAGGGGVPRPAFSQTVIPVVPMRAAHTYLIDTDGCGCDARIRSREMSASTVFAGFTHEEGAAVPVRIFLRA